MSIHSLEHAESAYHPDKVIILGHGRWGSGAQMKLLADHLAPHVGLVLTPDLPIQEHGLDYDDYADYIIEEVLEDHEGVEYWAHSRHPEVSVRVALRRPRQIDRLGFWCPRIPKARGQAIPESRASRITSRFSRLEKKIGEQITADIFPEFREVMCSQSNDAQAEFIQSSLRPQAPINETKMIDRQPDTKIDVVLTTEDGARKPRGVIADSRAYPEVEPISLRGDHYPHVNQAKFMALLILSRIGQQPFRYIDPKVEAPGEALIRR